MCFKYEHYQKCHYIKLVDLKPNMKNRSYSSEMPI